MKTKKSFNVNKFIGFNKDCLATNGKNQILFDILVLRFSETLYILLNSKWKAKFFFYVIFNVGSDFDGVGGVSQGCKFYPYPPRQIEVWGWDLGFIEGNRPQFEQSGGTQSVFPVHICSPHDLGGGGLGQYIVILYTVWSAVWGKEVAVKPMLGNMMVVAMAELGQVTNSW